MGRPTFNKPIPDLATGMPGISTEDIERFWRYVEPEPNSGCFLWIGKTSAGYGAMRFGKKSLYAHRISWFIHNGPIGDLDVLHRCDTPRCVCPRDLFLGTHLENMQDMISKGRNWHPSGAANPRAKLTQKEVDDMRRLYDENIAGRRGGNSTVKRSVTLRSLAASYGVRKDTVRNVGKRLTWLVSILLVVGLSTPVFAQGRQESFRINTYDTNWNRTGSITVNPRTGRIDIFNQWSQRLGYGTRVGPRPFSPTERTPIAPDTRTRKP